MRTMPPITQGQGHLTLTGGRLVVALDAGQVVAPDGGAVTLRGSSFIIPDVRVKDGTPAIVRLETQSSLTAGLSLLNQKPMQVMDKAGMPVALADGVAQMRATLALPLKRGSNPGDVVYHVEGELLDVSSSTLVKDRLLRGDNLKLRADNTQVSIAGVGSIDGVQFDGSWTQPIGEGVRCKHIARQTNAGSRWIGCLWHCAARWHDCGRWHGASGAEFQTRHSACLFNEI